MFLNENKYLQDTEDLVAGDALDHGDTGAITKHDTDLGRGLFYFLNKIKLKQFTQLKKSNLNFDLVYEFRKICFE